MFRPTLEEARKYAKGCTVLPVAMELYADIRTPVEILRVIRSSGREAYILESAPNGESWGRYTFLGYDPQMELTGQNGEVTVAKNGMTETLRGDTHQLLKKLTGAYKSPRIKGLPDFTGGFVGYFSYEYITGIEKTLRLTAHDDTHAGDFRLLLFDKVIAFDQYRQKLYLIVNVNTDDLENSYVGGISALKDMENLVLSRELPAASKSGLTTGFEMSFDEAGFCAAVEKIKGYIREGDIFQCVPSIRYKAGYRGSLLEAYRALRTTNPSAYMFYLHFSDMEIAGASPETLVSLKDGVVSTYPLAGTCPRPESEAEVKRLTAALLENEKELAEHDMLVDLGRNDLGKICEFGSVALEEYRGIKRLSHVCHIASKVTGRIRDGLGALDAMAAVLPAGTLSGAPKKRACEIIDEVENVRRGVYGGAVGYIDFTGNMDLCIGIRMAVLKEGKVYVQAGAGVVADSVPENEYLECLKKAEAMLKAIGMANKGVSI